MLPLLMPFLSKEDDVDLPTAGAIVNVCVCLCEGGKVVYKREEGNDASRVCEAVSDQAVIEMMLMFW